MGEAYTPGLKVTEMTVLTKERKLPLLGDVVVKKDQQVAAQDVVARTELPGPVTPVNVANVLSCLPEDVPGLMKKKKEDKVEKGEVIASMKTFFGLFTSLCKAPTSGHIEDISATTGQVYIRGKSIPVELTAYIDGQVIDIFENEGVRIRTAGTFIQGIFGIGPEAHGVIRMVAQKADDVLTEAEINEDMKGQIIVGGKLATFEAIQKAIACQVKGLVVGGFNDKDLRNLLGYDLGVAITGKENKGITLVITEGFGAIPMADKTFGLLKDNEGKRASINGATQIRAGVIRPEIIIPKTFTQESDTREAKGGGLEQGSLVRIIREPYFGSLGTAKEMPVKLRKMESETMVRTVIVTLKETGEDVMVPRANVEIIET